MWTSDTISSTWPSTAHDRCRTDSVGPSGAAYSERTKVTNVLDAVERSLQDFQPRNQREFVALQIARRFHDTHRLGRYVLVAKDHPKRMLLEAARLAVLRHELNRTPLPELFFEILQGFDEGEHR